MYKRNKKKHYAQVEDIDYKNLGFLLAHITETKEIVPSRISGHDVKTQRKIRKEIMLARFLGLLPYCDKHLDKLNG